MSTVTIQGHWSENPQDNLSFRTAKNVNVTELSDITLGTIQQGLADIMKRKQLSEPPMVTSVVYNGERITIKGLQVPRQMLVWNKI